jgi:hypothetical protein
MISARVGRAAARDTLCRGFGSCWRRHRGVAWDYGPKPSGRLINQLGNPSLKSYVILYVLACE